MGFVVTPQQQREFSEDGYLIVPGLLDERETNLLMTVAKSDRASLTEAYAKKDASGGESRLVVHNELDHSPYAAIVRSQRIVMAMQSLLADEVYHYHHKMMLKEPLIGGAWEWHQDYGYWYDNGCLYPDMASCLIAVDRATQENGCLQVVRGSHKLGRLEHGKTGGQTGANLERVAAVLERLELVYCELSPGDAIFFHGNTLHRSDQNKSQHSRWSLICCYNTKHNNPYVDSKHPSYEPLEIWNDQDVAKHLESHLSE
ncbi:phytanoyl-CoA dioxygenase family protein [bacterium]|jgi:ectoine hydroxylase-related dioxygenase (phytanoyl-CoA dioxygenase family)|nr:phytanoyl-CoA dioxygenase family protein [bacterium]